MDGCEHTYSVPLPLVREMMWRVPSAQKKKKKGRLGFRSCETASCQSIFKSRSKKQNPVQHQQQVATPLICPQVTATMLPRWSRALTYLSRVAPQNNVEIRRDFCVLSSRSYSKVAAAAEVPIRAESVEKRYAGTPEVNFNKMFWSKPCSLALAPDSPLRVDEPKYEGIRRIILKLMLFYSKQSKSIRGANVVYRRIVSQVDKPAIYNVFSLEKTFKTTFSLLVLHMWLCLRRMKQEGKEGVELGQYLYEIYNHDVELRVSKAGVNLLLARWMKDLEKIFYGNIVAYDAALLPEAKQDELENVLWRNVFADDGSSIPNDAGLRAVQAMSRYVRRESTCLLLTDKEAVFSGNFMFTPVELPSGQPK